MEKSAEIYIKYGTVILGILVASAQAFTLGHLRGLGVFEHPSYFQSLSFVFNLLLAFGYKAYTNLNVSYVYMEITSVVLFVVGFFLSRHLSAEKRSVVILTVVGVIAVASLVMAWDLFKFVWVIVFPVIVMIAILLVLLRVPSWTSPIDFVSRKLIIGLLLAFSWICPYAYAMNGVLKHAEITIGKPLGPEAETVVWIGEKRQYFFKCEVGQAFLLIKGESNTDITKWVANHTALGSVCLYSYEL